MASAAPAHLQNLPANRLNHLRRDRVAELPVSLRIRDHDLILAPGIEAHQPRTLPGSQAAWRSAALTDQTSADIAILYLRLALYLSPDLDLAKIVLADRFDALQKYDDAIAVFLGDLTPDIFSSISSITRWTGSGRRTGTRRRSARQADRCLKTSPGRDELPPWAPPFSTGRGRRAIA